MRRMENTICSQDWFQDDLDSNNVVNVGGTGWAISTLNANVTGTYAGFDSDFATKTTDDLTEGSTNLYYTTARADSDAKNAVSGGTGLLHTRLLLELLQQTILR